MTKQISVALIGSTGGGTATLGHTDPPKLIQLIDGELRKINGGTLTSGISRALFVSLDGGKGFDHADEAKDTASLYQISSAGARNTSLECQVVKSAVLQEVNTLCKNLNKELAAAIKKGEIQAIICVSVSVEVFSETLQAAAKANIPVTGTGGTSLSLAASRYQIRLVGNAGGSVANTSLTRAVSYAHALATDFNVIYRPWNKAQAGDAEAGAPSFKSILNACLPAFWGLCLLKRFLVSGNVLWGGSETVVSLINILENYPLPTACAVVAATSSSTSTIAQDYSSRIMASVIASMVCRRSVVCGLLAGYLVGQSQEKILFACICLNVPATFTNLVTTGGVGAAVAFLLLRVAPFFALFTSHVRDAILVSVTSTTVPSGVVAFLWGVFCCYGSKVGWYHSIFLPLILIEMECADASFLGALDELTLVLVCAGVCYGQLISDQLFPKRDLLSEADLALCKRAVRINLCYGDFVEACYPFMDQHMLINVSCYIASGASSSMLAILRQEETPKSLAYLPFPATIWLAAGEWFPMLAASLVAFLLPFSATLFNAALRKSNAIQQDKDEGVLKDS